MNKRAYRRHAGKQRRVAIGGRFGDNAAMEFQFDVSVQFQKIGARTTVRVNLGQVTLVLYNRTLRSIQYKGEKYCWVNDDVTYPEWLASLSTTGGAQKVAYSELLWHLNRFLADQSNEIIGTIMDKAFTGDET